MTDLAFQDRFVPAILDGSKPFTLRRAWANGRTPDVDCVLRLVVHPRTPQRRVFATARVEFRAAVVLQPDGIARADDWRAAKWAGNQARNVAGLLFASLCHGEGANPEALASLARLDGFADWRACYAWHNEHRARGSTGRIARELIGFGLVTPEDATSAPPRIGKAAA